jgi:hypothetical protein
VSPARKAQIAAAAKCIELACRERASLAYFRHQPNSHDACERTREGIKRLEEAADEIMALDLSRFE